MFQSFKNITSCIKAGHVQLLRENNPKKVFFQTTLAMLTIRFYCLWTINDLKTGYKYWDITQTS